MKLDEIFLFEATQYDNMFNDIFHVLDFIESKIEEIRQTDFIRKKILNDIKKIKNVFKRKDRIVWFLRYWKIGLIDDLMVELPKNKKINI